MSLSETPPCTYTIAPMSDSEPTLCGRPGIRHAILPRGDKEAAFEIVYCYNHWTGVKDLPLMKKGVITDLTEDPC